MSILSCCASSFATLSRAAANSASAQFRRLGAAPVAPDWARRATICESCHMRVVVRAISYCGRPLLRKIDRDPARDGCGCPTLDKAKSPHEHCPVDSHFQPAGIDHTDKCNCKWCTMAPR